MNNILGIAILALFIGGCATPAELRQKTPTLELKSMHDAKHVAACISDKWENAVPLLGTQPVKMTIRKDGYSVAHGVEETIHLVDIVDSASSGSTTMYYKSRNSLLEPFDPAVTICQSE